MISANRASAHACPNELAALERTDVHVGRYCNCSIYLILPGRDGWSPPSGHTHASTFIAATRHQGLVGSQPAAGGKLRNDHPMHVTVTVCMGFSFCPLVTVCVSCFTPSPLNLISFFSSIPLHPGYVIFLDDYNT